MLCKHITRHMCDHMSNCIISTIRFRVALENYSSRKSIRPIRIKKSFLLLSNQMLLRWVDFRTQRCKFISNFNRGTSWESILLGVFSGLSATLFHITHKVWQVTRVKMFAIRKSLISTSRLTGDIARTYHSTILSTPPRVKMSTTVSTVSLVDEVT